MINIKDFDLNLIKIDNKSYKNIGIYYIGYITIKSISDYENVNSVNPLDLLIGGVDLTCASTDEDKKVLEKYTKLWDEIKYHIQTINAGKSGEYEKDYMGIKLNSDYDLPLNKILKLHMLTIIVKYISEEDGKYYPQFFLDECLYEVLMLEYNRIDISEGIDINKNNTSKACDVCHYGYFLDKSFNYDPYLCNGCHDLMQKT